MTVLFQNFHSLLLVLDFKFRGCFFIDYNGAVVDIPLLSRSKLLLATGVWGDLLRYLPLYRNRQYIQEGEYLTGSLYDGTLSGAALAFSGE